MLSEMSDVIIGNMVMVVEECGKHYGFSAEEALLMLGIRNMVLEVPEKPSKVAKEKPSKVAKEKPSKVAKEKVEKVAKPRFALPYNGEFNADTCFALKGELYTQCDSKRIEGGSFCKGCQSKAEKNESGKPDSGTIKDRQAVGIFEYVDGKGKKPISYAKVMSKLKLTRAEVEEEAGKFNMSINEGHFVSEEKVGKGRPKREKKVLEIGGAEEDLFATLVEEANKEEVAAVEVAVEVEDDSQAKLAAKQAKEQAKAEERAAKKEADRIAKEQAKEQAKLEAEQKKEADRVAKEQAKEADRLAKEADRIAKEQAKLEAEQKKEADRLAKEQAKEAERIAKEQAKEQAKLEAEQKKEAAKQAKLEADQKKEADRLAKEAAKEQAKAEKPQPKVAAKKQAAPEETDEADVVKKIEVDGKKYLKSKKTGIIYDYTEYSKNGEQVVVGQWNEKTNKIDFKAADSEESEDEYDEDDN
jgi:hypothetical protein